MSMGLYDNETSFKPELSRRDLNVFVRVLSLNAEEQLAMDALYKGYSEALMEKGGAVRAFVGQVLEEAEVMQDTRLLGPAHARLDEWNTESEAMKKAFIEDLKSLLTREQEARWHLVERELRRLKNLPAGRLAGETVDLIRILEDYPGISESPAVAALLDRYSEELDRALVARDRYLEAQPDFQPLIKSDPHKATEVFEEARRLRNSLAEVNLKYVRLIAAELPPTDAAKLKDQVFHASYPALIRPTRTEAYLKEVQRLGSLTPAQAAPISAIVAQYETDRTSWLQRAALATRDHQLQELPEDLGKALGTVPDEPDHRNYQLPADHPLSVLRRERWELDKAAKSKVDVLLTPAQRDAVPDSRPGTATFYDYTPYGL